MTRKDYKAMAAAIEITWNTGKPIDDWHTQTHAEMVDAIARVLKRGNPRFDRRKFLDACGCVEV